MSAALITSADDVTAAWLTEALSGAGPRPGVAGGAAVTGFVATPVGTGQMGENARFELEWDDAGGRPASVVAKFPSNDPISRATATGGGSYAREVFFYRDIATTVDIRTPRCHFADVDLESGLFVLLMEDLAPAEQGDQLSGCDAATAATALAELVRLQAPRWNDATLHDVEWLGRRVGGSTTTGDLYGLVLDGFMERIGHRLDDEAQKLVLRFRDGVAAWIAGTPRDHLVVTHGDYRLDNMMFGAIGPTGDPVAVVDWQTPGHGHPATDLAYFLGAGLLEPDRRVHERPLVQEYHDRLTAAGVEGYSFDECWRNYRREAFAGIVMAVVASQIVVQTDRGDDMFFAMASRHATQALDLESESLI